MTLGQVNLEGSIDLHVHAAPDIRPRRMDGLALAREAAAAGMRAVLIKSHYTTTADQAAIVDGLVEGVRVFGGLALNEHVGGLNPSAVEVALKLGAREIWMPTVSAANHPPMPGGISILGEAGALRPEVYEILELIAEGDVILGTGHLSVQEIVHLVPAARAAGVQRILITHPELPIVDMPLGVQNDLVRLGVFFERCLIATVLPTPPVSLSVIARAVRELGPETTVLATDFGQPENPSPVEGLGHFITGMLELGISEADIERMTCTNPASLVGL